jgi:hypothetical protein
VSCTGVMFARAEAEKQKVRSANNFFMGGYISQDLTQCVVIIVKP